MCLLHSCFGTLVSVIAAVYAGMSMRVFGAETCIYEVGLYAGTVTNVKEAMAWLSYTYLYVRMLKNPLPYGVSWQELTADPRLDGRRHGRPAMLLSFICSAPCIANLPELTGN